MERLTEKRGTRSWFLFHLGWYLNLLLFLAAMLAALYFFVRLVGGAGTDLYDTLMLMSFVIIGVLLLLGAGISRYQARLEGQHLEIKRAVLAVGDRVSALEAGEKKPDQTAP